MEAVPEMPHDCAKIGSPHDFSRVVGHIQPRLLEEAERAVVDPKAPVQADALGLDREIESGTRPCTDEATGAAGLRDELLEALDRSLLSQLVLKSRLVPRHDSSKG